MIDQNDGKRRDDDHDDDSDESPRVVEDLDIFASTVLHRIIVPRAWGTAALLASAERGACLLFSFSDMPHLLCWRLPDDEDVVVEVVTEDDRRAVAAAPPGETDNGGAGSVETWFLPDDIDEERLRYPAGWGLPVPVVDAWVDGGPVLLSFGDGHHTLRWQLEEDTLLSLIADDSLTDDGSARG